MPPKSTPATEDNTNIRYLSVEEVPLDSLAQYVKNPRRGNVRAIAESLFESGQYRPIVMWEFENGKKRKKPEILAGNHTWKGAKFLDQVARGEIDKPQWLVNAEKRLKKKVRPWPTIGVATIDATKDEARKIVLADNRTPDLGGYDPEVLRDLLAESPDPYGTGFTEEEFALVTKVTEQATVEALDAFNKMEAANDEGFGGGQTLDQLLKSSVPEMDPLIPDLEDDVPEGPKTLLDAPTELQGSIMSLQDEPIFPGFGKWEIPQLRKDMLVDDLPPLETWAGTATKGIVLDPGTYWMYNYGIDSTSGMVKRDGVDTEIGLLSFYAWDEYFETWWFATKDRVIQALNTGIKRAITPNFSTGGMPNALILYNLYRTRYVGRYLQEAGIKVMPDLEVGNDPELIQLSKDTLPPKIPWASIQAQNISATTRRKDVENVVTIDEWKQRFETIIGLVRPDNLLVYANDNGFEMVQDIVRKKLRIKNLHLQHQTTRLEKLAAKKKEQPKKVGL